MRIDTSENGTIGAMIDNGYTLWAHCRRRGCNHSRKIDLQRLAQKLGRNHSAMHNELAPKLEVLGAWIKANGPQCDAVLIVVGRAPCKSFDI